MSDDRTAALERAAELLADARASGRKLTALPPECRPTSEAEAYVVQDAVARRLGGIAGWKVGAAGPTAPIACAPLLKGTVLASPARLSSAQYVLRGVESEIAYRIGRDLAPRAAPYTEAEVRAAIADVVPTIEVCESRFVDHQTVDPLCKLADMTTNGALVVGPARTDWASLDPDTLPNRLRFDAAVVVDQRGGNAARDLMRLLVWLANHASARGHGLRTGDVITTGSWVGLRPVGPDTHVVAAFDGLGEVEVTFEP